MSFTTAFFLGLLHFIALVSSAFHLSGSITEDRRRQLHPAPSRGFAAQHSGEITHDYWHTAGNRILEGSGKSIRIQGINWYGFETVRKVPGGLEVQDYHRILETIHTQGFNVVRIPFSNDMVEHPIRPKAVAFKDPQGRPINEDLRDLDSLEILDRIVDAAGHTGLKVILDNHRSEAGDSAQASGLWYTVDYPESAWIADWRSLVDRYRNNSTVIGVDLRNEPHNANAGGACWSGCTYERDWHLAAQRGGNAILAVNPRLIIFVEGTDCVGGDCYWWGGNLQGVRDAPVHLNLPNQLVYSTHTYGPNEFKQSWFNNSTTPSSLSSVWHKNWAFVSDQGLAPLWVGEFGAPNSSDEITDMAPGSEGQWFRSLIAFLETNRDIHWTCWALNSEDADGLLRSDYAIPANTLKMTLLSRIMTGPGTPAANSRLIAKDRNSNSTSISLAPSGHQGAITTASHRKPGIIRRYIPHLPPSTLCLANDQNLPGHGSCSINLEELHIKDQARSDSQVEP